MDLYQKKRYYQNQGNKGIKTRYDKRKNELTREENYYLQKMLEQNKLTKENMSYVRTNMKTLLADENSLKKAINYVTRHNRFSPNERYRNRYLEKSASPLGRRQKYQDNNQTVTPLRKVLNITREPFYSYNNTLTNASGNDNNQNRVNNKKEENYDIEISSINENGMPQPKSPQQVKYKSNYIRNEENEDDINELITTIEDLQSIINGQKYELKSLKKENRNKDKEIEYLKNEVNNLKNEMDKMTTEYNQDMEDVFKDNDVRKLKKEYLKLLQDYDDNINDYNNLKDEYNKMVDEYNNIKTARDKLLE